MSSSFDPQQYAVLHDTLSSCSSHADNSFYCRVLCTSARHERSQLLFQPYGAGVTPLSSFSKNVAIAVPVSP